MEYNRKLARAAQNTYRVGALALSKTISAELGPMGITVNTLGTGAIATPQFKEVFTKIAEAQGQTYDEHIAERTAATNPSLLQSAMFLLVNVSAVEDQEVFKICLEYWNILASDLYHTECQFQPPTQSALVLSPIPPHAQTALSPTASPRRQLYSPVLSRLRSLLVSRMAKPDEFILVEDENGEIVRETARDVDAVVLYKTMRETLVYLTHLNYEDTETIMLERLQYQVDGSQWSWNNLKTLCWAIGSISGAVSQAGNRRSGLISGAPLSPLVASVCVIRRKTSAP